MVDDAKQTDRDDHTLTPPAATNICSMLMLPFTFFSAEVHTPILQIIVRYSNFTIYSEVSQFYNGVFATYIFTINYFLISDCAVF